MNTFNQITSQYLPQIQATVTQYADNEFGVRHIHVDSEQTELAFLVAFPTVPDRSDGRAHILEHMALSGSVHYPVRDPFFSMMRRSVATFMNAMTYPDRTVYLFSSTEKKDFLNLLDVYLDAVFFPKLDYLSFLQEGWRYEINDGVLGYQGVVFNEMKGVFGSPIRALMSQITAVMLKGTTYEMESGGDPLHIPELSHQMLLDFHATHYHPSQAIFMSFGKIDADVIQHQINEQVLMHMSGKSERRRPELAPAWTGPQKITVKIPAQSDLADGFGVQYAWLLGESASLISNYEAYLLYAGLLGDSSAPLMQAMESAGYGRPSQLNGSDDSARQIVFHIGMEGLTVPQIELAQTLIWDALNFVAREGIAKSVLKAALRDLKYQKRNMESGQTPYGLSKLLDAVPVELNGGHVIDAFDGVEILSAMEKKIENPDYFKQLVQFLIDSPTQLLSVVEPDLHYFSKRDAIEAANLDKKFAAMSEVQRAKIVEDMAALDADQQIQSNTDCLPRITPADVSMLPMRLPELAGAKGNILTAPIASNGIVYANVIYDISGMPEGSWNWLNIYVNVVEKLGAANKSYQDIGAWRKNKITNFHVSLNVLETQDAKLHLEVVFAASSLSQDRDGLQAVIIDLIQSARFDELDRISFLIQSIVKEKNARLADAGDQYARQSALAPLSATGHFEEHIDGISSFDFYQSLYLKSVTVEGLKSIAASLKDVHNAVTGSKSQIFIAGEPVDIAVIKESFDTAMLSTNFVRNSSGGGKVRTLSNRALHAAGQVNHCVVAWNVPRFGQIDAGVLAVTAELISNQILHRLIRERGGAYGGKASYISNLGIFMMSSYRDPRLAATYADFLAAIDWILDASLSVEAIEEAIVCVIKMLDKPLSPYGAVHHARNLALQGVTDEQRAEFRKQVLECNMGKIVDVVRLWLKPAAISRAAFVGNLDQDLAGLEVMSLQICLE